MRKNPRNGKENDTGGYSEVYIDSIRIHKTENGPAEIIQKNGPVKKNL